MEPLPELVHRAYLAGGAWRRAAPAGPLEPRVAAPRPERVVRPAKGVRRRAPSFIVVVDPIWGTVTTLGQTVADLHVIAFVKRR